MNREKNKGLLQSLIGLFFIIIFEIAFIYIWRNHINILKATPFENKGNWLIAAVYCVELVLLLKVYGGLKIGHLTRGNLALSQCLALVICNAIMFVQMILMVGDMHLILEILKPMILLTAFDIIVSIVFVNLFDALIQKIYPPKAYFIFCLKLTPLNTEAK